MASFNSANNIVLLGETGVGKSQLAKAMTGSSKFVPSASAQSATQNAVMEKRSDGGYVIDTPGLKDSAGQDTAHITTIAQALKRAGTVNAVALVVNSGMFRLDTVHSSLKLLVEMFGSEVLKNIVVVFSRWPTDPAMVARRAADGVNEGERTAAVQMFFRSKMGYGGQVPCVFGDFLSGSQDACNQLIQLSARTRPFECKTVQEVKAEADRRAAQLAEQQRKQREAKERRAAQRRLEAQRKCEAEEAARQERQRQERERRDLEARKARCSSSRYSSNSGGGDINWNKYNSAMRSKGGSGDFATDCRNAGVDPALMMALARGGLFR